LNTTSAVSKQGWDATRSGWALLNGLRPAPLDLDRVHQIRNVAPKALRRAGVLEAQMVKIGLNDEGMNELPESLHPACGVGLRVWQYPIQFAPYLRYLSQLQVRSYLEIGIRHGGSFVLTIEVLERFLPLEWAIGVDIIPCSSLETYAKLNPRAGYAWLNTQTTAFTALCEKLGPIDLVFIDSHHTEDQCRREVAFLRPLANMIAMHDIVNVACPGVRIVWEEIKAMNEYNCVEFTDQYEGLGPFMGIGLAVRSDRRLIQARGDRTDR
jgi:hypothetical protein